MVTLEKRDHNGLTFFWANDPGSEAPESILAFNTKKNAKAFIKDHLLMDCSAERIGNRFWVGWGVLYHSQKQFFTKGDFAPFQS